ncbi:MAG: hypothetical protein HC786_18250 [Richelia sp. CSU_2_1]|nr:hypothetical protein [Microcoleus sp. SU_5_3]NJL67058.1 hypothetical protein [Microcoleus sp. SM1_3_4]NJR23955.1 hypothetical protein [Richelia sp. CSU_2_1]
MVSGAIEGSIALEQLWSRSNLILNRVLRSTLAIVVMPCPHKPKRDRAYLP